MKTSHFLPLALVGNAVGAASYFWQGPHPLQLFFACMFGYSVRWALDQIPDTKGGRDTDPLRKDTP